MTLDRDFGVQNLNFKKLQIMHEKILRFFSCPQEDRGKTNSFATVSTYCIKIFQLFWLHLQFFGLINNNISII